MEIITIVFFLIAGTIILALFGVALNLVFIIAKLMSLLDYILIGIGMWWLTHRIFEWHTVFVITSILVSMFAWLMLTQITVSKAKFRPFNILGAIVSSVAAAIMIDYQIRHPIDPLFGQDAAAGYDVIWQVFTYVVVILIIGGIRLVGSVSEILDNIKINQYGVEENTDNMTNW